MAEYDSNLDALAAAAGLSWQPLDVADTLGLVDGASIVSASTVGGLWTVTMDAAVGFALPFWRFALPPGGMGSFWSFYVRLTDLAHPAAAQDIRAAAGIGEGTGVNLAVGYTYPVGTTDLQAEGTLDNYAPTYTGASTPRAGVTEVRGDVGADSLWINGGVVGGVSNYDRYDAGLGAVPTEIFVTVRNAGPTQQTISFRPEFALVNVESIS